MVSKILDFIRDCFGSCSAPKRTRPKSPTRRADYYNAQVRTNLGMADRHLEFPTRSVSGPSGNRPHALSNQSTAQPRQQSSLRVKSPRGRLSTTTASSSGAQWALNPMGLEELKELFNLVHETLAHVPYAICGLGALIDHGFTHRRAKQISIICPKECKHNVKAWCAAQGYQTYVESVGIPLRDGSLRRVRIKYINSGFERLERVRSSFSNATVLSMASQLDNIAAGYLETRRRGDQGALETIAKDVFWCLDRIASSRERIDPTFLPTFLGEDFFQDFTAKHRDARPEMARAGIDVSAVLARHRAAANLREHDEMLQRYGMQGDVISRQPGQFESMRDLAHSKSVYTLHERDSRAEPDFIPPMPHLHDAARVRATEKYTGAPPGPAEKPASRSGPSKHHSAREPPNPSGPSGVGRSLTSGGVRRHPRQYHADTKERPVADWI